MFSRQFPEGDLGGNRFGVKIEGKPTRLHTYWDNVLGEVPGWENDTAEHQADVYALVVKVRETRDPKYSREALQEALSKNTFFASWIAESHELAKTVAYCNGPTQLKAVMVSGRRCLTTHRMSARVMTHGAGSSQAAPVAGGLSSRGQIEAGACASAEQLKKSYKELRRKRGQDPRIGGPVPVLGRH